MQNLSQPFPKPAHASDDKEAGRKPSIKRQVIQKRAVCITRGENKKRAPCKLKIPLHLSAATELRFDKERLTPEEITEENCCNLILPRPFHPKLSGIAFKHPMRCLAAAAHFLIRKKLFNSKYPQLLVAKDFAVAENKTPSRCQWKKIQSRKEST